MSQEDKPCSQHPNAPHGFDRNASHNAGRYVCECEGWEPVSPNPDEVICQNCCHQFRAIPQNVQRLMLNAGFEPPFTQPVAAQEPVQINPVAHVTGYFNGYCVVAPLDTAKLLPVGMALYTNAAPCTRCAELEAENGVLRAKHEAFSDQQHTIERQRKVIEDVKQFINTPISVESCTRMNASIAELEKGVG